MGALVLAAALSLSTLTAAQAQDCRACTRQASVSECVKCNMAVGGYTLAQSQKWCAKNQPLCGGKNR